MNIELVPVPEEPFHYTKPLRGRLSLIQQPDAGVQQIVQWRLPNEGEWSFLRDTDSNCSKLWKDLNST